MKCLIEKSTNLVKFVFEEDESVSFTETETSTEKLRIPMMNSVNSLLLEGLTIPDDWTGNKYLYRNNTWELNPDWTEPVEEPVVEEQPA